MVAFVCFLSPRPCRVYPNCQLAIAVYNSLTQPHSPPTMLVEVRPTPNHLI